MGESLSSGFEVFVDEVGPRLREGFISAYGPDAGAAVTARTLRYAKRNWEQVESLDGRVAHLFGMGRKAARWYRGSARRMPKVPHGADGWIEAALPSNLRALSSNERIAVLLFHGFRRSLMEIAELLNITPSLVQLHAQLGLGQLATSMGAGERDAMRHLPDQVAAYSEVLDAAAADLAELRDAGSAATGFGAKIGRGGLVGVAVVTAVLIVGFIALDRQPSETEVAPSVSTQAAAATTLRIAAVELLNPQAVTPATFSGFRHAYAGPGGVVFDADGFHMLAAAYGNGVGKVTYLSSDDGVIWTPGGPEPVLDLAAAPWAPLEFEHAVPRSLIVDRDGIWQLFFEIMWFDDGVQQTRGVIGRAVAGSPDGDWSFDADPIIRPDNQIGWRSTGVVAPSVVASEAGLLMLFIGLDDVGNGVVGVAQSIDGLAWDVRPGPVYGPTAEWTGGSITRVDLVRDTAGFVMLFAGSTTDQRGLATSINALDWDPSPLNPFLTTDDVLATSIFDSEFVPSGDGLLAYVENGDRTGPRQVSVLRIDFEPSERGP